MNPKKFNAVLTVLTEESPQVIEMEKFVLGAMLLKDGEIIPEVVPILKTDDFYRPEHRIIFDAILKLKDNGVAPDIRLLVEKLRETVDENGVSALKQIGIEYVLGITEVAHTTAYAEGYAKQIKEKSLARQLIRESALAIDDIKSGVKSEIQVADELQEKLRQISLNFAQIFSASRFTKYGEYFTNYFENDVTKNIKAAQRKTGFYNIDAQQIFSPGLYLIGGTPASGKTTFVWQLAEQLAQNGEHCIFCSYEMSRLELFSKSICRAVYRNQYDEKNNEYVRTPTAAEIRRGDDWNCYAFPEVLDKLKESKLNLKVLELHTETIDELLRMLRPLCTEGEKAPVVVIDYLQIIPNDKDNAKFGIDDTVRKLKVFQRDTGTTFIVVSSFNRQNYAAPVSFESFKESGNIEYTADVVWGLQLNVTNELKDAAGTVKIREVVDTAKKRKPARQIHLRCLKNRQGNNYDCYFHYHAAHDYFKPCEKENFVSELNATKKRVDDNEDE